MGGISREPVALTLAGTFRASGRRARRVPGEDLIMPQRSQVETWIAAAQNGDELALTKLLTTYHGRLRAQAQTRMPAALQARRGPDDVLQEVYLDVFRQVSRFEYRGPGSFLNWLYAILDRKVAAMRRAAHYQMRDVDREIPAAAKGDAPAEGTRSVPRASSPRAARPEGSVRPPTN
jgi:DNA-directed RNA polymerase specialized sigma24 family protein